MTRTSLPARARLRGIAATMLALALAVSAAPLAANADPIGTVTGTVSSQGIPIEGAYVNIGSLSTGIFYSTQTDAAGTYSFASVELGEYQLGASASGPYIPSWGTTLVLTDDAPTLTIDVELQPIPTGTASIGGTVSDSATGLPVAGGTLSAYDRSTGVQYGSGQISSDGTYLLTDLPAGSITITYFATGYGFRDETVDVADGATIVLDVAVVLQNSSITGRVLDQAGQPAAANFQVSATAVGSETGYAGFIDSDGNYTISSLPAGTYTVTVGGIWTPFKEKSKTVTVAANGTATANFTAAPRTTGSILGYVLGDEAGSLQNICVDAIKAGSGNVVASTLTTAEGTFLLENLKQGDYKVRFTDCDATRHPKYAKEFWQDERKRRDATIVTVSAAEEVNLDLVTLSLKKRGNN